MNKFDWYFEQLVTEADLDEAFLQVEEADHDIVADDERIGILSGLAGVQHDPVANLTVDISAGVAYDQEGQRIRLPSEVVLDVSVDSASSSTAVAVGGNEKWVSVFIQFERDESDTRLDGNGNPVNFNQAEGYAFIVTQGAEAAIGVATRPALRSDAILLFDVNRTFGQTQILNADIDTDRREYVYTLTASSPITILAGTTPAAMQAILDELNGHISDLSNPHDAASISFSAAGVPAGWTNLLAATEVQAAIDGIADDLAAAAGAARVGSTITATWADASTVAATNVDTILEEIVSDLAAVGGAARIGNTAAGNLVATNVQAAINELDTEKGGLGTSNTWTSTNTFSSNFNASGVFNITSNSFTYREASNEAFASSDTQFRTHSSIVTSTTTTVEDIVDLFVISGASSVGQILLDVIMWVDNTADNFLKQTYSIGFNGTLGGTPVVDFEEVTPASVQGSAAPSISPTIVASGTNTITFQVTYNANTTVCYLLNWRVQYADRNN